MIYSFSRSDKSCDSFLKLLRQSGIDFDLAEHDHVVVRLLGQVTPDLERRLESAGFTRKRLILPREPEGDIYEDFHNRKTLKIIAGPCAVETEDQLEATAAALAGLGVKYLRGGAYKPRTSVDSFQGLGLPALKLLRSAADRYGMAVISEVMDRSQLETVAEYADVLQVGSRNMYNYTLLTTLGSVRKPVLLKRGMAATVDEWLKSAEYVTRGGNSRIILCERGVRTFEPEVAHTLDLAGMLIAARRSGFPIIADASHSAGRADLVSPLAVAAVAAGADGIMVEVHPRPHEALSDSRQALTIEDFAQLLKRATAVFAAQERDG